MTTAPFLSYRTAIKIDPELAGPRTNLAALLGSISDGLRQQMRGGSGQGVTAGDLERIMKRIQKNERESFELRKQEFELLKTDLYRSRELPNTHPLHFQFALSCYLQQKYDLTEKHMLIAHRQAPEVPRYLLGLATFYRERQQYDKAVEHVQKLLKLDSEHPGFRNLATELSKELEFSRKTESQNQ